MTSAGAEDVGPAILERYEILRQLGRGSFGRTVLGRERSSGRTVAIKLLDSRSVRDWKHRELFEREAAVLRGLRHQGVPEMHDLVADVGRDGPVAALVMEYVEGVSLGETLEGKGSLDPAEVVDLFVEMLGILDYLHSRVPPVLHRDIKPSNIIIRPDGRPALVDFGSVRHVFHASDDAGSTVVGTYGYMPYEQYMGQASPSSDLYALGATFLHLLTRRPPRDFMSGDGAIAVPEDLPGDARLRPIIARLLRASPAERFASAREVRQALLSGSVAGANLPVRVGTASTSITALPSAPRMITGDTARMLERLSPSMWDYMDGTSKRTDRVGVLDVLGLITVSVVTLGIMPLAFYSIARKRRRRVERFLREGTLATARIINIQLEESAFAEKIARVSYQFDADGRTYRDSDQVLPLIAGRWQQGDAIEVLHIVDDDCDSVIISTT